MEFLMSYKLEHSEGRYKVKVKLSLCFNWSPRHEGVLGQWRCSSTHSCTRHWMEVSDQLQNLAALHPGKERLVYIG